MSNFILNETMIFDDRDSSWLYQNIESMINYKNTIYKKLVHHNDNHFFISKTYFKEKLSKPKGSTLKIYFISYRTKTSTLESTGHS